MLRSLSLHSCALYDKTLKTFPIRSPLMAITEMCSVLGATGARYCIGMFFCSCIDLTMAVLPLVSQEFQILVLVLHILDRHIAIHNLQADAHSFETFIG